jgi:hypothetical protein
MSPPDWQQLHDIFRHDFWAEVDTKIAEAAEWGFPKPPSEFDRSPAGELILPEGVFWFAEFVKLDSCKHRTVRELRKFLRKAGYPKEFSDPTLVTIAGYQKALANWQKDRRNANAKRKREKRAGKTPKTKEERGSKRRHPPASANQVPEPI